MNISDYSSPILNVFKNSLGLAPKVVKDFLNAFKSRAVTFGTHPALGRSLCFYDMAMAAIIGH
jgi:hypothetical protein